MSAHLDYSAALGIGINIPIEPGSAESKHLLDRSTRMLANVAKVYRGHVLDASGGNLSILFSTRDDAMQAACEMRRRVAELATKEKKQVTVSIGASARLGTAMVLMLDAAPGEIATDRDFVATLETPTVTEEIFTPAPVASPARAPSARRVSPTAKRNPPAMEPEPAVASVPAPEPVAAATASPAPADVAKITPKTRLVLTFHDQAVVVDDRQPQVILGRGPGCQMQIVDLCVSRVHASVLKQGGQFLLMDSSSNGTFVQKEGESEVKVSRSTHILTGRGSLGLGQSGAQGEGNRVRYELL